MDDVIAGSGHVRRFTRQHLAEHCHQGLELIAVLAGRPRWQVEGHVMEVPAGWVHVNRSGQRHGSAGEREAPRAMRWAIIKLDRSYEQVPTSFGFHPDLGIPAADARRLSRSISRAERHACPASPQLLWLIEQLVDERQARRRGWRPLVARYAAAAIYELERCLQEPLPADEGDQALARVERFLSTLADRCAEPWTLQTMAAHCGLGRTRFSECCHALAGENPMAVVRRRRVERAQVLLRGSRSITEIALDCGFGTSQHFARIFKRVTGRSASAYRAEH